MQIDSMKVLLPLNTSSIRAERTCNAFKFKHWSGKRQKWWFSNLCVRWTWQKIKIQSYHQSLKVQFAMLHCVTLSNFWTEMHSSTTLNEHRVSIIHYVAHSYAFGFGFSLFNIFNELNNTFEHRNHNHLLVHFIVLDWLEHERILHI